MTQEEIQSVLKSSGWDFIGKGTYNRVYRSRKELTINGQTCYWVLKISISPCRLDAPERVVRKWNEINPEKPAFITKHGWIAPYLGNQQAKDEQISSRLVDIYRRTGNIIADACAPKNFLYSEGITYCVDFDHAFKRRSTESDKYSFYQREKYQQCFKEWATCGTPISASIIQALGFLETLAEPETIEAEIIAKGFLTVRILQLINNYRICGETLPMLIQHLPFLARIEQIDPDGRIPNRFIVPSFVSKMIEEPCEDMTFELFEQYLAAHMILAPQIPFHQSLPSVLGLYTQANEGRFVHFIQTEDLDGIRLLYKCDNDLVHQRYLNKTGLQHAAEKGKIASLRELIDLGSDIYATSHPLKPEGKQSSALELAISLAHRQVVKILVDEGYQSDERTNELLEMAKNDPASGFALFLIAAQEDMLELLMRLLQLNPAIIDKSDAFGHTALIHAAIGGHLRIVQYLLEQKADASIKTRLPGTVKGSDFLNQFMLADWALYHGHQELVLFLKPQKQDSIIMEYNFLRFDNVIAAMKQGDLVKIQWLLPPGSLLLKQRLNWEYTALHVAMILKQDDIADYLIRAGADITLPSTTWQPVINDSKCPNMSAWRIALYYKNTRVIRSCLEHALEQLLQFSPDTAIIQAASLGLIEPIKRLVDSNPSLINTNDEYYHTPISLALVHGHTHVVQFLIEKGAKLNIPLQIPDVDYHPDTPLNGCLPLDIAYELGKTDMIQLLQEAGATRCKAGVVVPKRTSDAFFFSPEHFFYHASQTSTASSSGLVSSKPPDVPIAAKCLNPTELASTIF